MRKVRLFLCVLAASFLFLEGCGNMAEGVESMKNVKDYEDLSDEQIALLAEANLSIEPGEELNEDQLNLLEISAEAEAYLKEKYGMDFTVIAVFRAGLMQSYTEFWAEPADGGKIYGMTVSVKAEKSGSVTSYTDDYAAYYAYEVVANRVEAYFEELYGADNVKVFTTTSCLDWTAFDGSQTAEELVSEKAVSFYSAVILSDSCMNADGMEDAANAVLDRLEEWGMIGGMHLYLTSAENMDSVNVANYTTSEQREKWLARWILLLNADGVRRAYSLLNDN